MPRQHELRQQRVPSTTEGFLMAWSFVLDGVDVSGQAFDKKVTRRLNRPASAEFRIRSEDTDLEAGTSRLKVYDDSDELFYHGIPWLVTDEGDEDTCWTKVQCVDPMVIWRNRPARDADGDFSFPSFWTTQSTGPQIMKYLLDNSETHEGDLFIDTSSGTIETGGVDLSGTPVDYPMTIADVWSLLADTGQVDVVLTPADSGSTMAVFNGYNGDFGDDLSGSVALQFQTGAYNVRSVKRSHDMDTMANKLWYLIGPKKSTVDGIGTDPQHWRTNVTGDHPFLANPPGGDVDYANPLGDAINASRDDFWVSMDIRIHDSSVDAVTDDVEPLTADDMAVYLTLWQAEQIARVRGRQMMYSTPIRGMEPPFDIGDLITVEAGTKLRGGFSGTQRVYEYTVAIDNDGVTELGEVVTSADQESV